MRLLVLSARMVDEVEHGLELCPGRSVRIPCWFDLLMSRLRSTMVVMLREVR